MRLGNFALRELRGDENPTDLFAKNVDSQERLHGQAGLYGYSIEDNRWLHDANLLRVLFVDSTNLEVETADQDLPTADPAVLQRKMLARGSNPNSCRPLLWPLRRRG